MDSRRTCCGLVANDTVLESDSSDEAKIRFPNQNSITRVRPLFPQKTQPFSTSRSWLAGCDGHPVNFQGNRASGLTDRLSDLGQLSLVVFHALKPSHSLLSHVVSPAIQQTATALTQEPVVWLSWWALDRDKLDGMNRNHLERCHEMGSTERAAASKASYVSLETEIPEVLYRGMKDFIGDNPSWDQYRVMSSALAHFLFQNGCDDRAVTERYLDDLFIRPDH